MPFEIPDNLHPDCAPIAWLLGTWAGNGHGDYPTIDKFEFGQELIFTHDGRPFFHYLSRAWIVDEAGETVGDSERVVEIARSVTAAGGGWREISDTRLAPGERRRVEWRSSARGAAVKVFVEWRPDRHYERLYRDRLARRPPEEAAAEYRRALEAARASPFVVWERSFATSSAPRCR